MINLNENKLRKNSKLRNEIIERLEILYKEKKENFIKDYITEDANIYYDKEAQTGFLYFSMNHQDVFNLNAR